MIHEEDAVKYAGTDVEIEWDNTTPAEALDILIRDFKINAECLQGTGIAFYFNRINCTYNNYKRNTKTLIL